MPSPLATPTDVADVWRPLSAADTAKVARLISDAEAILRQKLPFDLDERMALDPSDPLYLAGPVVKGVIVGMVKRVLVNPDDAVSSSESTGPYSKSTTFADAPAGVSVTAGGLVVIEEDLAKLRPAVAYSPGFTVRTRPRHHHHDPGVHCL